MDQLRQKLKQNTKLIGNTVFKSRLGETDRTVDYHHTVRWYTDGSLIDNFGGDVVYCGPCDFLRTSFTIYEYWPMKLYKHSEMTRFDQKNSIREIILLL